MALKKSHLITGGAGFIGSNLCAFLLGKGLKVTAVDNFITGNRDNIESFLGNKNFTFIQADVSKGNINEILNSNYDYVYHLASPASPPKYRKYSLETMQVNSEGTRYMLDIALKNKSVFFLASTSEVYGDPLIHPQRENYFGNVNPVGPRSCYDESKRFAESLTMEYFRIHKLKIRIGRIFNTYGPNMDPNDGRVISNFINQAINGKDLTVYGEGRQTRSFCFVSDMVRLIYDLTMCSKAQGEVVNLGNPDERSVFATASIIKNLTGSKSAIRYTRKMPENDPARRKPDISKALKLIGSKPKVSLEDGLMKTIFYFKNL